MSEVGDGGSPPRRADPVYVADRMGVLHLFVGQLEVEEEGVTDLVSGALSMRLEAGTRLEGRVVAPSTDASFSGRGMKIVGIPDGQSLRPERRLVLGGVTQIVHLDQLDAGNLQQAERLLVHVAGELASALLPRAAVQGGGAQDRVEFELLGWQAALVAVFGNGQPPNPADFTHVVEITPPSGELEADAVEQRLRCLFWLLSFVAGQDVAATVVVGVDRQNAPVWASWARPKRAWGHPGIRWCPEQIHADAIPIIAEGLATIWPSVPRRRAVTRAIGYLGAVVRGVLEVRVPVACVGLEVLASEVLKRSLQLSPRKVDGMRAAPRVRRMLELTEISTAIPTELPALTDRLLAANKPGWEGPEILMDIRNWLVHPTKMPGKLDVPDKNELIEAWQLATWYLDLAILRQLGYNGAYSSRLRLGRWEGVVEPVPWASVADASDDDS